MEGGVGGEAGSEHIKETMGGREGRREGGRERRREGGRERRREGGREGRRE